MNFDLEERTAKFGENVIKFCNKLPQNNITKSLINQLIRSATSVGANYCEANEACSNKDFRYKIRICNREVKESKHWLKMIAIAVSEFKDEARKLWLEAHELNLIFSTIIKPKEKKDNVENDQ